MVDGAKVVKADIATSNGVIHLIDKVMLPKYWSRCIVGFLWWGH
ncbi:MAG: fasciclin domain-containing protein [Filomicrobium sp.]